MSHDDLQFWTVIIGQFLVSLPIVLGVIANFILGLRNKKDMADMKEQNNGNHKEIVKAAETIAFTAGAASMARDPRMRTRSGDLQSKDGQGSM